MGYEVSVIIPVYQAGDFLEDSVRSALAQPETAEVILIEDGSKDNSLALCKKLASQYKRVKLFQHHKGKNKGAAASRNLGISKASKEFIAFLDADDFFGENRFAESKRILSSDPSVDGVYEATGSYFQETRKYGQQLTTLSEIVPPENLFFEMGPIGEKEKFYH